jgi:hypothetical protein
LQVLWKNKTKKLSNQNKIGVNAIKAIVPTIQQIYVDVTSANNIDIANSKINAFIAK